ncbi:hypothetical protein S7711_11546 [Stachybotrys chartarum IBT 7711]|uniref:Uncharacterized protein n=1 Tax=Stachybotrys chartarum (strain CBS 109288 / IBT 7711) TaxID=1280523 RepID=A0A084AEZ5_STACB|nr:hypothetical protein S7711_11546 [Stachybotrys chartarum IBT 7711]
MMESPPKAFAQAGIMASPNADDDDLFEPNQVSTSITADEALQFLEDHGLFYQEYAEIGQLVDELYRSGRAQSDNAKLGHFKPTLLKDLRLRRILGHYSIELTRFRLPWGSPGSFYCWDTASRQSASDGLVMYMVRPGSTWICCDRSHNLVVSWEVAEDRTIHIEEKLLEGYAKKEVRMKEGGV